MTGSCEVCGQPAQTRMRATTYPHRRGPLGWLVATLAWSSVPWRWVCTEHAGQAMRAAIDPGGDEPAGRQ